MGKVHWTRYFFLDASAIVKLLANEVGSENLLKTFNRGELFRSTWLSVAEAYGVLKRKWLKKEIEDSGYLNRMYLLNSYLRGKRIKLVEGSLDDINDFTEAEDLFKKYSRGSKNESIDLSDALQLVAMKKEFFPSMVGKSALVFVTTDGKLEKAAINEGIKVWNCIHKSDPPD